ncbi:hypothetical protein [Halostagnicola bangensis]
MTDRQVNAELSPDPVIAERVRQQLETFPEKFRELGEGGELRKLCRTPHTLSGPIVEQQREHFTEQYLIEPVLHGLGYRNPISDEYVGTGPHFIRRPSTYRKIEIKRPDFLLKNISPQIACILEAKAVNEEQATGAKREATDDIRDYVDSSTFAKYLTSREKRYLVAIGTDGLRWVLWAKDVRSDETKGAVAEVDLSDSIEAIAQRNRVIEGDPNPEWDIVATREFLRKEFVPVFSARTIVSYVRKQFE